MSDMRYSGDELRNSGKRSRQSSEAADSASRKLSGSSVGNPFGNVSVASGFAGVLAQAQNDQAKGAKNAAEDRDVKAQRADKTAGVGDELTVVTTKVANQGVVQNVSKGM